MQKLFQRLAPFGIFLLKGTGWAAVGIFVGFVFSYFIRFPGRVDTFALTETLLGVIITGLSIVAAFIVAFQWSNLDSKIHIFEIEVQKTQSAFDEYGDALIKLSKDTKEDITTYMNEELPTYIQGFFKKAAQIENKNQEMFVGIIAELERQNAVIQTLLK